MNKAIFPIILFVAVIFDLIIAIRYFPPFGFVLVFSVILYYLRSKPLQKLFPLLMIVSLLYDASCFYIVPIYTISISAFMFIIYYLGKKSFNISSNLSSYFLTVLFSILLLALKIFFDFQEINATILLYGLFFFLFVSIISTGINLIFNKYKL